MIICLFQFLNGFLRFCIKVKDLTTLTYKFYEDESRKSINNAKWSAFSQFYIWNVTKMHCNILHMENIYMCKIGHCINYNRKNMKTLK